MDLLHIFRHWETFSMFRVLHGRNALSLTAFPNGNVDATKRSGRTIMIGRRICVIALTSASAIIASAASAIAQPFDGNWSIAAQTTRGPLLACLPVNGGGNAFELSTKPPHWEKACLSACVPPV
jgi:hypothetical protein